MHVFLDQLVSNLSTGQSVRTEGARESPVSEHVCAAGGKPVGNHEDARQHFLHLCEEKLPSSTAAQEQAPGSRETSELSANILQAVREH